MSVKGGAMTMARLSSRAMVKKCYQPSFARVGIIGHLLGPNPYCLFLKYLAPCIITLGTGREITISTGKLVWVVIHFTGEGYLFWFSLKIRWHTLTSSTFSKLGSESEIEKYIPKFGKGDLHFFFCKHREWKFEILFNFPNFGKWKEKYKFVSRLSGSENIDLN